MFKFNNIIWLVLILILILLFNRFIFMVQMKNSPFFNSICMIIVYISSVHIVMSFSYPIHDVGICFSNFNIRYCNIINSVSVISFKKLRIANTLLSLR